MSIDKDMQELLRKQHFNDAIVSEVGKEGKVLLIGAEGKVVGKDMPVQEAVARAKEDGNDIMLVESKKSGKGGKAAGPFVCKYFNLDQWMEERKAHLLKKKASVFSEVQKAKEMKFSINITEHDADTKCRKIESFLGDGYSVRVVLFFAPPLPYNAQMGEEFFEGLLDRIPDEAGTCSAYKHAPRQGEISVELTPHDGVVKGRKIYKKK